MSSFSVAVPSRCCGSVRGQTDRCPYCLSSRRCVSTPPAPAGCFSYCHSVFVCAVRARASVRACACVCVCVCVILTNSSMKLQYFLCLLLLFFIARQCTGITTGNMPRSLHAEHKYLNIQTPKPCRHLQWPGRWGKLQLHGMLFIREQSVRRK